MDYVIVILYSEKFVDEIDDVNDVIVDCVWMDYVVVILCTEESDGIDCETR